MELINTKVKINLPDLIIKNTQRILRDDKKAHVLAYEFWLASFYEDFGMPIQVLYLQTTKDILRRLNHVALPVQ